MRRAIRIFVPTLIVFILVNVIILLFRKFFLTQHFDIGFLFISNGILFGLSVSSFLIERKALISPNNQAFIRGIYTSMIIKFFVCMASVIIYIITLSGQVNQPALFSSMGLYMVYSAFEVYGLMKITRRKDA